MKSPDFSTATPAESSMDDNSSGHRRLSSKSTATLHPSSFISVEADEIDEPNCQDGGDSEMWTVFNHSFQQVQSVLDRNRVLIQQVNENHQSKVPDNMVKNVALTKEINGNISKVVSMYSNLSSNFSSVFHDQNAGGAAAASKGNSGKKKG